MSELENLMSELSWLKRLASALVRDESDANDLVQETWLVAAEHAPTDGRPLKPWLGRVALNLVRMRSRATKRRIARETAVEPAAPTTSPDDLVGRVRAQRVVADAVLKLAEPYRNTVLLHYFEELSSAEIARRSGIPEGTVRRRLKVALDELRGQLHAEERKTGQAVVALLAPIQPSAVALKVLAVKKLIAVVAVAIGLLFLGSTLYKHRTSAPIAVEPLGSGHAARPIAKPTNSAAHVTIAVADSAGPIANANVRCAPKDGEVVVVATASDGYASIDLAPGEWSIAASAEGHEPAATTIVVARDDHFRITLLTGGQTLSGTVTDMTGGVIVGARIDAVRLQQNAKAGTAVAVAFSDRAGQYKLAVGAGAILVAASHSDYAPQTRYVDLGAAATANFALVPGGVIDGIVRDLQTNLPVAGATVRSRSDSSLELGDANERVVKADAAGKFHFAGLRPGSYSLSARADTRSSRAPIGVGVGIAEQQTNIAVMIGATATLRGKVVDDTGAPAPDVIVSANGAGGENDETTTDAAGAFVFEGLPPNRWALRGKSASYVADGQAIVLLKKADVDGIVVRVHRGLDVKGHVEPRKVCDVEIAKPERDSALPGRDSMTTNADGEFHFAPFQPGTGTLVARCPTGEQGTITVAAGGEAIIPLAPGGAIEGRVVDANHKPIAAVMVNAELEAEATRIENGALVSGFKAMSSTTGTFSIGALGAGKYRLSVLDSGRPMKASRTVELALSVGQHASNIEVVVDRPTGVIQGTVTGPDNTPIADAWVSLHQTPDDQAAALPESEHEFFFSDDGAAADPPPAMTDASGHFEMTNLLNGRYQLSAEAQSGKLHGAATNVTTDAQLTVRLEVVSSLHGTVHGARGPTDLFSVALRNAAAPTGVGSAPSDVRSFTDGAFEFPRLDPGTYAIDIESTEGTGRATVQVTTNAAASVDITLVPNGTVTGRIVDKSGKPLSGMGVLLIPDQAPGQLQIIVNEQPLTTGPDGRFAVQGAPGMRALAVLGHSPTVKRGLSIASGNTIDVGDLVVEEQPK